MMQIAIHANTVDEKEFAFMLAQFLSYFLE